MIRSLVGEHGCDQTWASGIHTFYGTRNDASGSRDDEAMRSSDFDDDRSSSTGGYDASQPNDRIPTNTTGMTPGSLPIA